MSLPHWRATMMNEINVLHHNHTWSLVPKRPEIHVIGINWVYETKFLSSVVINQYQTWLVAVGILSFIALISQKLLLP